MDFLFAFYVAFTTRREKGKKKTKHKYTLTGNIGCVLKVPICMRVLKKILVYKNSPVNSFYRKI